MSQETELANRIWDIFSKSKPQLRKAYFEILDQRNDPEIKETGIRYFSDFNREHLNKAHGIFSDFKEIADQKDNEMTGISAALDAFEERINTENPDLLFHALQLFLTHWVENFDFQQPSIFVTNPELIIPSKKSRPKRFEIAVGSPKESKLDWFREDPLLNEHHGHWHIVYDPDEEIDRQGEMFFYMHRQMLARYDVERHAADVKQVVAFDDMEKPIAVGYAAGEDVRLSNFIGEGRNVDAYVNGGNAQGMKALLNLIFTDIDKGDYDAVTPAANPMAEEIKAVNILGSTIESNSQGLVKDYTGYHGFGHGVIADVNNGVMRATTTAIRDVVFWEWHKGIDDIYERWIKRLSKHGVFADVPPVTFRKFTDDSNRQSTHDIIICKTANIEGFSIGKGKNIGQNAFGNANWENDFQSGVFTYDDNGTTKNIETTSILETKMNRTTMIPNLGNGEENTYPYEYLTHEPFCYFIRVQSNSLEQKQVTVRLFMVPVDFEEDHEKWIEMDKFLYELPPDSKHVIFRSDEQSSVVRKPIVKDPTAVNTTFDPVNMRPDPQKCTCGWPYHLLLPRGKKGGGMKFRLMVMVTDGNIDLLGNEPNCGSLSFCGSNKSSYPDQRPLGYPFNRLFEGNGKAITNSIAQNDNMACRDIFIKHS